MHDQGDEARDFEDRLSPPSTLSSSDMLHVTSGSSLGWGQPPPHHQQQQHHHQRSSPQLYIDMKHHPPPPHTARRRRATSRFFSDLTSAVSAVGESQESTPKESTLAPKLTPAVAAVVAAVPAEQQAAALGPSAADAATGEPAPHQPAAGQLSLGADHVLPPPSDHDAEASPKAAEASPTSAAEGPKPDCPGTSQAPSGRSCIVDDFHSDDWYVVHPDPHGQEHSSFCEVARALTVHPGQYVTAIVVGAGGGELWSLAVTLLHATTSVAGSWPQRDLGLCLPMCGLSTSSL